MSDLHMLASVAAAVSWRATPVEAKVRQDKIRECARVLKDRKMVVGGAGVEHKAVQVEHELFYAAETEEVYRMHEGDAMRMFFVVNLVLREIYENPLDGRENPVDDWGAKEHIPTVRQAVRARVWEMLNMGVFDLRAVATEAALLIETFLFKDAKSRKDFSNHLTLERRVQRVIDEHPEDFQRMRVGEQAGGEKKTIRWEWEHNPHTPGGGGRDGDVCCLGVVGGGGL
jgi:hypothetical protein